MVQEKLKKTEYIDGTVYDEAYFEHGGHGSPYQGYTGSLLDHPGFKEYASLIVRTFRPQRVLEVGCATGIIVNNLRNLGIDVTGIDISEYATRNAVCDSVLRASAADLPFADDSFDVVFGCHCIEHIPPFLLDRTIEEQARVSRRWVFHVMPIWNMGPYQWTLEDRQGLHESDITDLNLENIVWWVNKFVGSGKLRYRPDVRLEGFSELWQGDYNHCQVCFEKESTAAAIAQAEKEAAAAAAAEAEAASARAAAEAAAAVAQAIAQATAAATESTVTESPFEPPRRRILPLRIVGKVLRSLGLRK
jgi:SAM-dependent methyltransferase